MQHIRSKLIQQSAEVQQSFLADRSVFMGFAILLVVVYHLVGVFHLHGYGIAHVLGRGYVGVDIFLFFSGLGLCYSCTKNSLSQFYKNRFVRIYPLYFIMATLYSFTFTCCSSKSRHRKAENRTKHLPLRSKGKEEESWNEGVARM